METVLEIINIIGIISFAAAGAMVAIDKETDLFGVVFLSLVTCFCGGLMRDMMAGQSIGLELPAVFTSFEMEIIVCILTALAVFFLAMIFKEKYVEEEETVEKINNVLDALGLGVFASVGTAAYAELGPFVAITMGLISSVGGSVPDISQIAYGTSKAAINYLTKLIAVHEAKHKIRCNAVLPGMTATDAVKENLSDDFRTLFLKHIPLGRMGLPEEIASAVVYFASDDSAYTTGQILTVCGGFGLATPVYGDLKDRLDRR